MNFFPDRDPELLALLPPVLAAPRDDLPRRVYADRCLELGYEARGQFILQQLHVASLCETCGGCGFYVRETILAPRFTVHYSAPEYHDVQPCPGCNAGGNRVPEAPALNHVLAGAANVRRLKNRCDALLGSPSSDGAASQNETAWTLPAIDVVFRDGRPNDGRVFHWTWSRGFISNLILSRPDWVRHGDRLLELQPVEQVTLTPPVHSEAIYQNLLGGGCGLVGDPQGKEFHSSSIYAAATERFLEGRTLQADGTPGDAPLLALCSLRWPSVRRWVCGELE